MRWIVKSVFLSLILPALVFAQSQAPDAAELTKLLNAFLAGAGRNDVSVHDRFWAEDLIYTGSSGRRVGKADILRDVRAAPAPKPGDPETVYTAADVRINEYGDTAVVAFRLVGTTMQGGATQVANYLNTGTFLRRDGKWQAVSWQATRLPLSDDDARKEVAATDAAFHQAMLAGDTGKLENLLDETFARTIHDGTRQTRREVLEELRSGRLKFARLETRDVTIDIFGDAAVVRGRSLLQRSAVPGAKADASPFDSFYTMTLIDNGGRWKIVALHAGRR